MEQKEKYSPDELERLEIALKQAMFSVKMAEKAKKRRA